jgi:cell division protein FtsI (penicillin-binding protein 3)
MVGLGIRLAFLHLGPHDGIREKVQNCQRIETTIAPGRGTIFDCKGEGNALALSLPVKDICADPAEIVKHDKLSDVATQLSEILGQPAHEIVTKLGDPRKRYAGICRFANEELVNRVRQRNLTGVFFEDTTLRHYPNKSFMCHVLGFVNYEGQGIAGVEQSLDKYLRGSAGLLDSRVNALRQELYWQRESYVPAVAGASVCLTMDQNVQYIVEKALEEAMKEHHAQGAWAIVQRVRTGEILAMASLPSFDLNEFPTADKEAMLNRAIGSVYEPGSTFKAATIAAAFNEGTVKPETVFDCENGAWTYKKRVLRDYHPYGMLTVADGLKKSSNILTAKVALMLGEKRVYEYLRAFGIGSKAGVDLPGEETGILHPVSQWSDISITRVPIGQGVAVTALQMLGVFCAIANDGFLMKPFVVSRVTGSNGAVLHESKPEVLSRPITFQTAATMKKLLSRVTEEGGTGIRAQVEGYEVAGKTGSAQKPVAGGYSSTAYMASFVGFLPAEDPEIGLIVVIDEPQPLHTGGVVAGPVFSRIANQTVRCLDIPPTQRRLASAGE